MANCERGYVGPVKMGPQSWERDGRMRRAPLDAPVHHRPGIKPVAERPGQAEALRQMNGTKAGNQIPRKPWQPSGGGVNW